MSINNLNNSNYSGIQIGTHRQAPEQKKDIQAGGHRTPPTLKGHTISDLSVLTSKALTAQVSQSAIKETNVSTSAKPMESHQTKNCTIETHQAVAKLKPSLMGQLTKLATRIKAAFIGLQFIPVKQEVQTNIKAEPLNNPDTVETAMASALSHAKTSDEKLAFIQRNPLVYKVLKELSKDTNHVNALQAAERFMELPSLTHLRDFENEMKQIGFARGDNPRGYAALQNIKTFLNTEPPGDLDSIQTAVTTIKEELTDELDLDGYFNKVEDRLRSGEPLAKYTYTELDFSKVINDPPLFKAIMENPNVVRAQQANEVCFVPQLNNIFKILTNPTKTEAEVAHCRDELKTIYEKHLQHQEEEDVVDLFPQTKEQLEGASLNSDKPIFANLTDSARQSADNLIKENLSTDELAYNLKNLLRDREQAYRQVIQSFQKNKEPVYLKG